VVEGYFDALMARAAGVSSVALGGTSVGKETVEGWQEAKEIVLCLDSDKAGHEGLVRIVRMLPHMTGMPPVSVLPLPADSDLDEVLREEPGCFEQLYACRVPWLTHVVRSVLQAPLSPADEVVAVRRVGAVLKASLAGWPAEVGVALKEASRLVELDERFMERVVGTTSTSSGT
jgi:DNA primase